MNARYFGIPLLAWALLAWVCAAGGWLSVRVYRALIGVKDSDELFITPEEMRQMRNHVRDVDFWLKAAGRTAVALLAVVVVIWALGGRV